jgi:anti-sigma regulatory factor (Ser/Thr protein kinase)
MSTYSAQVQLPALASSVPAARHVTSRLLAAWTYPRSPEDAQLIVTELVSNVIDHVEGETHLLLELTVSEDWLRISVADGSSVRPFVHELAGEQPRGLGMFLVATLSSRWGVEDYQGGKRVWVEMDADDLAGS